MATEILISRRQWLAWFAAQALPFSVWASGEPTLLGPSDLRILLPHVTDPDNPSFEVFLALSQLLTCRNDLDQEVAQAMYPLFMDEPWGKYHIASSYRVLSTHLLEHAGSQHPDMKTAGAVLTDGQRWFVEHMLITWYTGVYYHQERQSRRVTYRHALMFDVVAGFPVPGIEPTGYGNWSERPLESFVEASDKDFTK